MRTHMKKDGEKATNTAVATKPTAPVRIIIINNNICKRSILHIRFYTMSIYVKVVIYTTNQL